MHFFRFLACYIIFLPFVGCSNDYQEFSQSNNHKSIKENLHKLSPQMTSHVKLHGFLLWVSMGLLMPVGILTIRMSNKEEINGRKTKVFFYLHVMFQVYGFFSPLSLMMLSVLLASTGAVMSIKNLENSFNNNHQRLGLVLYGAMWVQVIIGFLRPLRGNKRRSTWYFVHWLLGTTISLVGIINIYTGLKAYHNKTSRSTTIWTMLFTAELSFIAFFYLFQDKWEYIQKQGLILDNVVESVTTSSHQQHVISEIENDKVLLPEPCGKHNALKNLFD